MKKETFADRLNLAMRESGVNQPTLAEAIGIKQPSVWKMTTGKTQNPRKLLEISKVLNVRPEWLSSGEEPMRADDSLQNAFKDTKEIRRIRLKEWFSGRTIPEEEKSYISQLINGKASFGEKAARRLEHDYGMPIGYLDLMRESSIPPKSEWGTVAAWDSNTALSEDEVEVPFLRDIEFACGDGRIQDDDYNGFKLRFSKSTLRKVGANTDGSGVLCFPVTGDSMEPMIPDGTTVAVDTNNKRIVDGKIYAIAQEGGGNDKLKRIKQLYRKPGGIVVIHSFNRDADEEAYESELEIIGRVFWYSVLI
ncbi:phage repressor protein [Pectobacterium parmentieri]|nr:phage repressor protein [Pectobacterium parmentieri]